MKKILLAVLILFLAYAATGWFLVPHFVDKALRQYASKQLGLELTFDNLLLYPFSFSTHLENLVVLDRNGDTLFTASEVNARSGFLGFWTWSGAVSTLVIAQPRIHAGGDETSRRRVLELVDGLTELLGAPGASLQIASLSLQDAAVVRSDNPNAASGHGPLPGFSFTTESLGKTRTGPFQLTVNPPGQSAHEFTGDLAWGESGAQGMVRFATSDGVAPIRSSDQPDVGGNFWEQLTVEAPFTIQFSPDQVSLAATQASARAESLRLAMDYLVRITAQPLTAEFDATVDLNPDGLVIRKATAITGDLTVSGLNTERSSWIDVPVQRAEFTLAGFALASNQPISFGVLLQPRTSGQIELDGQYDLNSGNGAVMLNLAAVPLSTLINPSAGLLPAAIASEPVSARGRLQISSGSGGAPLAAVVLSGQVSSGATLNLSGMTHFSTPFDRPLKNSRFELDTAGLDATLLSSWAETFANRHVLAGTFGANLDIRSAQGKLSGVYGLKLDHLQLKPSANRIDGLVTDPDFTVALLQDSDNHIEFSIPLTGEAHSESSGFSDWLASQVESHLAELDDQPFDTLARMLGIDSGVLNAVAFEPGQAGLTPLAVKQLEWLKTALQWRPGLALGVGGGYDPESDRYALASQQIRLHVNLATAISSKDRDNDAPINFADPKARSVLDEFAGSRLGRERVQSIASEFLVDETVTSPQRAEAGKMKYYQALFDALVGNEQITERTLLSIARYRARTIIDQLARHGVEKDRLKTLEQEAVSSSVVDGVPAHFELSLNLPPESETDDDSESFFSRFD